MMNNTNCTAALLPTDGLTIDESYADELQLRALDGTVLHSLLIPIEWNGRRVTEAAKKLAADNNLTINGWN